MSIPFYKYNGTGNDFIMIDNRDQKFDASNTPLIHKLCTRHFGIGADGLILLENEKGFDFKMVYFNSDGNESTMCGNGGRCIIRFAHDLKIIDTETHFSAIDGPHMGKVLDSNISLQMQNVSKIEVNETFTELDTGSPHYVAFMDQLPGKDFVQLAGDIRRTPPYTQKGINVNFASITPKGITMRTFERGVEDETLACGTGATAVAISAFHTGKVYQTNIPIHVIGGELNVSFDKNEEGYSNIWLTGPAEFVFEGKI
ncbi:MAG: diaminopimelate epimerase [Salibacteraceae bacterium]